MKKDLIRTEKCDGCGHRVEEHDLDDRYVVDCLVNGCDCEEYDEDYTIGDDE